MRTAIGVHGRFYAFELTAALVGLGEDVSLFTNYPRSVAARFGVPRDCTHSLVTHGVAARVLNRVFGGDGPRVVETALKRGFGKWLAHEIGSRDYDVAFCWSGVAEETFRRVRGLKLLNRSSLHIVAQQRLLATEAERAGRRIDRPTPWIIDREQREYALADRIVVPSRGARRSFEEFGLAAKVVVLPLTATSEKWRPAPAVIDERIRRISHGERLRVLYVGALSYRKGLYDMAEVVAALGTEMSFRFTGAVLPEARAAVAQLANSAIVDGHVPEDRLTEAYAWADVLMCPSIEDGFGVVLAQALGAGVPILASENTGGPDLLAMGGRGWIVPIRAPGAIADRLRLCDGNRAELATMVRDLYDHPLRRTWADVANDFDAISGDAPR